MIETVKGVFVPDKLRFWSLTTYATEHYVRRTLESKEDLLVFACYIHHDDEGVEPHIHINLVIHRPIDSSALISWFKVCLDSKGEIANTFAQPTKFTDDAYAYLIHKQKASSQSEGYSDDEFRPIPNKKQYLEENIKVLYGDAEWYVAQATETQDRINLAKSKADKKRADKELVKAQQADDIEGLLSDVVANVPLREMARRYGRDFVKNRHSYYDYAFSMHAQETGELLEHLITDPIKQQVNEQVRFGVSQCTAQICSAMADCYSEVMANVGISRELVSMINQYVSDKIGGKEKNGSN